MAHNWVSEVLLLVREKFGLGAGYHYVLPNLLILQNNKKLAPILRCIRLRALGESRRTVCQ
jgi:hypothetical protein